MSWNGGERAIVFPLYYKTIDVLAMSAKDNCHGGSKTSDFQKWLIISFLKSPLSLSFCTFTRQKFENKY